MVQRMSGHGHHLKIYSEHADSITLLQQLIVGTGRAVIGAPYGTPVLSERLDGARVVIVVMGDQNAVE